MKKYSLLLLMSCNRTGMEFTVRKPSAVVSLKAQVIIQY